MRRAALALAAVAGLMIGADDPQGEVRPEDETVAGYTFDILNLSCPDELAVEIGEMIDLYARGIGPDGDGGSRPSLIPRGLVVRGEVGPNSAVERIATYHAIRVDLPSDDLGGPPHVLLRAVRPGKVKVEAVVSLGGTLRAARELTITVTEPGAGPAEPPAAPE